MSITYEHVFSGRLGNQIFRNLAVSFIAEKFDLHVTYSSHDKIDRLGIPLFVGNNKYDTTVAITDDNFFSTLEQTELNSNIDANRSYFQIKEISNYIYNYLQSHDSRSKIIDKNPYKVRYNANNDVYIHIRLGDMAPNNPGINYYLNAISNISFENIFLSTDQVNHSIILEILQVYPNTKILNLDEIETIQLASTCKHIILSHGSFSAIIGYLSFYSNIQCPKYDKWVWCGNMFSIPGWVHIE